MTERGEVERIVKHRTDGQQTQHVCFLPPGLPRLTHRSVSTSQYPIRPIRKYSRGVICRGRRCPIGRHRFSRRRAPRIRHRRRAGGRCPRPSPRYHLVGGGVGGSVVPSRLVRYHIPSRPLSVSATTADRAIFYYGSPRHILL